MKRIIMHWTGGLLVANSVDREHYHEITQGDGSRVMGRHKPEANLNPRRGQYAAHTRALNTGSIGLAVAGMHNAIERPFNRGPQAITPVQIDAFTDMVAEYCSTYGIKGTRRTVLTHAEVQTTLGVWQRSKWDITWLPDMTRPADPVAVGDRLRAAVLTKMLPPPSIPQRVRIWAGR